MTHLLELVKSGFFDDCENFEKTYIDKKGRLDVESLSRAWETFQHRKYCMKYYLTHGNIMPSYGLPPKYQNPRLAEAVYKTCLETGSTWQEETGYEAPDPDKEVW